MAPQPKRKHSLRRGRIRTQALKAKLAQLTACPSCKKPSYPHMVCPHCGFYGGKSIVVKKEKKKEGHEDAK